MLLPALVGALYREPQALSYLFCALITMVIGLVISLKKPDNQVFYAREGLVSVGLSWLVLSLFGCIPFILSGDIPHFVDAFFEIISGFTTTGSSILKDVEAISHTSLFWRSLSHWIGGMGVLVFILSVLPMTGGAALHLMRAESPGPQVGKIVPKMRDSAFILYLIYTIMTILEIVILLIGKMPAFDAVTLSLGSAGTGGFSVRNSGLADYSAFSQYVIATFILLFGVNFNVYFLVLRRQYKQALKCEEMRWYFLIVFSAVAIITLNIIPMFSSVEQAFRHSYFQVASIITTTGYATTDFNFFPELSREILLLLMFIGACAGSTGGGIKVSRIVIGLKSVKNELSRIIHPRSVKQIRFEGKPLEGSTINSVHIFIITYVVLSVVSLLAVSLDNFDTTTNFSAVAATLNNIGPGLNRVGPYGNFSEFSDFSKLVFCFDMLAGRLEIFPILVLANPNTWRKPFIRKKRAQTV